MAKLHVKREQDTVERKIDDKQQLLTPLAKDKEENLLTYFCDKPQGMPYLKRINSLPLINHISYKYAQVSDIGPSWSSCFLFRRPWTSWRD